MRGKLRERSRHLLYGSGGKGRGVVVAALENREGQAALNIAEEHGRLRDADPLGLHPCHADDLARDLGEADRFAGAAGQGLDYRMCE